MAFQPQHGLNPRGTLGSSVVPGCRLSPLTSQMITSSGSSGLNQMFGGGIPVGTVLAFEDKLGHMFGKRFLQVFASEGLAVEHKTIVAAAPNSQAIEDFVKEIPSGLSGTANPEQSAPEAVRGSIGAGPDELKIAWRYENLPNVNAALGSSGISLERDFDLGKKLTSGEISKIGTFCHFRHSLEDPGQRPYQDLIPWIYEESKKASPQNVLRVCLPEIDSPLWGFRTVHDICRFLFQLRGMVRHTYSIICLSFSHGLHEVGDLHRLRRNSDAYIAIETLPEDTKSLLYKEFQAILRLQKGFTINALRPHRMTDHEFGLKIKRRKIVIERLHLPPALQETSTNDFAAVKPNLGAGNCQATIAKGLDF